jgi:HK97 family phage prohead protease
VSESERQTERAVFVRTYDATLTPGDGRTLDMRLVPYNVPATVADPPTFRPYQETFLPGAFERQLAAPDRVAVWLNFEHEGGLRGIVGHGLALRDAPDALEGSFRVHSNADGDKALQLVNDELVTGASIEFAAIRSRKVGDVVQRLRAHIDRVSLCRNPAYSAAGVLAVREAPDDDEDDEAAVVLPPPVAPPPLPPGFERSSDVDARLARLGIETLQRVAITDAPWDASRERFTDEQFAASSLLEREGVPLLPVLEPDGTVNRHALELAAVTLSRGGPAYVTRAQRTSAARKLIRYCHRAGVEVSASLRAIAAG